MPAPTFSANLGFLWTERALPEAIRLAADNGFAAVECHFPYETDPSAVREALEETGLDMLSLNTGLGPNGPTDFGLAADPGRISEARELIDQALDYAEAIGCRAVSVFAGRHRGPAAAEAFANNLSYAAARARPTGIGLLVEPLSPQAVPGYHVHTIADALAAIDAAVGPDDPTITVMVDIFHTQRTEGDVFTRITDNLSRIGHIQFAAVPDRGTPDHGEIDYQWLLPALVRAGWSRPFGAEYVVTGAVEDTLGFMSMGQ